MPLEDPIPTNDYTALAVQLGVIQEGQRNTLDGINDIKETLKDHGGRIGTVEARVDVLKTRVDGHDTVLKESREDAKPEKGRWTSIGSFIVAAAAIIFLILDRFYLPAAH